MFYFLNHPVMSVKPCDFVRERRVNKVGRGKDLVFEITDRWLHGFLTRQERGAKFNNL